jgi:hypothetical protein
MGRFQAVEEPLSHISLDKRLVVEIVVVISSGRSEPTSFVLWTLD